MRSQKNQNLIDLERAMALSPTTEADYIERGLIWLNLKFALKAATDFKLAIKINPDNINAHKFLGAALIDSNEPLEALSVLNNAIKLDSSDESLYRERGIVCQALFESKRITNYQESLNYFKKAFLNFYKATLLEPKNAKYYKCLLDLQSRERLILIMNELHIREKLKINLLKECIDPHVFLGHYFWYKNRDMKKNLKILNKICHYLLMLDPQFNVPYSIRHLNAELYVKTFSFFETHNKKVKAYNSYEPDVMNPVIDPFFIRLNHFF